MKHPLSFLIGYGFIRKVGIEEIADLIYAYVNIEQSLNQFRKNSITDANFYVLKRGRRILLENSYLNTL